jgi:uncharacterized protein (UPF0276 family)
MISRNVGKNCHNTLLNTPEERISHLHRAGSLKSSKRQLFDEHSKAQRHISVSRLTQRSQRHAKNTQLLNDFQIQILRKTKGNK